VPNPAPAPEIGKRSIVVEMENSSWIVERGVRHTEWFVQLGGVWIRAAEAPDAATTHASEDSEPGRTESGEMVVMPPGCQYLCRLSLRLPVGTPVRRRVSMPRRSRARSRPAAGPMAPDLRRDILSFFRYPKPPLAVVETEFRVARRGLVPAELWERKRAAAAG